MTAEAEGGLTAKDAKNAKDGNPRLASSRPGSLEPMAPGGNMGEISG